MKHSEFRQLYADELAAAFKRNPAQYSPFLNIADTAAKMTAAIPKGSFNLADAYALKALFAKLGVPCTRPAIIEWFKANVEPDDAAPPILSKANVVATVEPKTDLTPHIGRTIYARTAMNAYFGKLVREHNGKVEITEACDTYGNVGIHIWVPKISVWAVVQGSPRRPGVADLDALRQ